MKPRSLAQILTLPVDDRYGVLASGLELIAEHALTLAADAAVLLAGKRPRGAAALSALAREHAARYLILLDLVRLGWRDQKKALQQLKRCTEHRAAGIYAEVSTGRPADLAEVRRYVDSLRRERYLDGPSDVDWVFRNQIDMDREDVLYVDYVSTEEGSTWVTPATRDADWALVRPERLIELVGCMHRAGFADERALDIIASVWRDVLVEDDTHWEVIRRLNVCVVAAIRKLSSRLIAP